MRYGYSLWWCRQRHRRHRRRFKFSWCQAFGRQRVTQSVGAADPYIFLMCSSATIDIKPPRRPKVLRIHPDKIVLFNQCESIRFTAQGEVFRDCNENPSFTESTATSFIVFVKYRNSDDLLKMVPHYSCPMWTMYSLDLQLLSDFLDAKEAVSVEVVDKTKVTLVGLFSLMALRNSSKLFGCRLILIMSRSPSTNTLWIEPAALLDDAIELPWHEVRKTVDEHASYNLNGSSS